MRELVDEVDLDSFNIVYCPHPLSTQRVADERMIVTQFSTFDMLFIADSVVSDYSTIIYEAGLRNLPVYLYAYDWQEYKRKRECSLDFEKEVPTVFSHEARAIVSAVEKREFDYEAFRRFVEKNVRIPPHDTCCGAIIALLG